MSKKNFSQLKRKQSFKFKIERHYKKLPKQVMLDHIHSENKIVEVLINGAKDLAQRNKKKKPNAYCLVYYGKRKLKTSTQMKTTEPVWKEVLEFDIEENSLLKLKIEVWHKTPFLSADIFLGYCSVDLSTLPKDQTEERTETLLGVESGEIYFEITSHCFGIEKPSVSNISEKSMVKTEENNTNTNTSGLSKSSGNRNIKTERYKIEKLLGGGGQGQVFLTMDHYLEKQVVMKRIICESFEDANLALQENRTLNHPNIVHYSDVFLTHMKEGSSKGKFAVCFIMDYCKEGDLSRYLKRRFSKKKYLELPKLIDFTSQIVDGINYLHSDKIMHRDLKPHNIFLTNEWKTLKVGDFGFVRELDKTYLSTKCGSPGYMSPEVAGNQGYNLPADIWSLGVILYEMATLKLGKVHFVLATQDYDNYIENIKNDLQDKVEEEEFVNTVLKCLLFEQKERPDIKKIKEVMDELKKKYPLENKKE